MNAFIYELMDFHGLVFVRHNLEYCSTDTQQYMYIIQTLVFIHSHTQTQNINGHLS